MQAMEEETSLLGVFPPPIHYEGPTTLQRILGALRLKTINYSNQRSLYVGKPTPHAKCYSANIVCNQKYTLLTFLPLALYQQFKFFFNMYFLVVAISQFYPPLVVGFMFTYVAPLAFVIIVSLSKEAYDDIMRFKRDREANSEKVEIIRDDGTHATVASKDIVVGSTVVLHANQRVPADCVVLRTSEKAGASFIRTDQLDGETDWKLRFPVPATQELVSEDHIPDLRGMLVVDAPSKEIYKFSGKFINYPPEGRVEEEPLGLENTLWANCVVATGTVVATVIYTGKETRSAMNASSPVSKTGILDLEINFLSKVLFVMMLILSAILVVGQEYQGQWYISMSRFFLLFSSIIPISMRVNLDMAKSLYSVFMMRDPEIKGTIVRNSTIPEELGRISYLFSDKTGTLTRNEMEFKKFFLGPQFKLDVSECADVQEATNHFMRSNAEAMTSVPMNGSSVGRSRAIVGWSEDQMDAVMKALTSMGLCHNVTPVVDVETQQKAYQASSPDEVSIVKFSEMCGVVLEERTPKYMKLLLGDPSLAPEERCSMEFDILYDFPFSSERKRMGIIVKNRATGKVQLLMKGADSVMIQIVKRADWLEEECMALAQDGLRTLVFGQKELSPAELQKFTNAYKAARCLLGDERTTATAQVLADLEIGLELVGLSGVEDRLQEDVQMTLEKFRYGGIRVWMLTGDKVETATCIARSARLVSARHYLHTMKAETTDDAASELDKFRGVLASERDVGAALIVDGSSLAVLLEADEKGFIEVAMAAVAVVIARCSPTQKALVVEAVKRNSPATTRTAAIGDGGNDVSMITAAHVGLGIEGKEGRHASLAADFSLVQFSHSFRTILVHGRNSYRRSCRMSQFIMHRGLIISFIQALFSAVYFFTSVPLFTGWLLVGYATVFTMFPVFAMTLDEDIDIEMIDLFPELYVELQKARSLNLRTFLQWTWISIFQSGIIFFWAYEYYYESILKLRTVTFTALILCELFGVAIQMHLGMLWRLARKQFGAFILSEVLSLVIYGISMAVLGTAYFDVRFVQHQYMFWVISFGSAAVCLAPVYVLKRVAAWLWPSSNSKVRG